MPDTPGSPDQTAAVLNGQKLLPMPDPFELFGNAAINAVTGIPSMVRSLYDMGMQATQSGPSSADPAPAMQTALMLSGRAPFAPEGAAGVFGGRLAKTADLGKLAKAQEMAQDIRATSPKDWYATPFDANAAEYNLQNRLTKETGWFQMPDGKWRFQLSNEGRVEDPRAAAYFRNNPTPAQGSTLMSFPLPSYMQYPALRDAYPNIYNNYKITDYRSVPSAAGQHWGDQKIIGLDPHLSPTERAGILEHELQHAIQTVEDFAPGSAPTSHTITQTAAQAARNLGHDPNNPIVSSVLQNARNSIYRRFAGEQEARAAEGHPTSGDAVLPWDQFSVAPHRQIVPGSWVDRQSPEIQGYVRALTGNNQVPQSPVLDRAGIHAAFIENLNRLLNSP